MATAAISEHQVPDAGGGGLFPDELEHRDELAEDEHLMIFGTQLFDSLHQFPELGRRDLAVRGVDEREVAADLRRVRSRRFSFAVAGSE